MKGAIVDLDGTVYRSETPITDAVEGIRTLRAAGLDVVFVSNTSTKSRKLCLERLETIGIDADREEIVTSASVTATHVEDEHPNATVMAIGEGALLEELGRTDLSLTESPEEADVLVVGKDRNFGFETLTRALRAIEGGATFVVTNRDRTTPTDRGPEPGSGAVVAAIAYAADREPDTVAGKPHDPIVEVAIERLGAAPGECLVVGDNPEMDVEMGVRSGMTTVLVTTGVAARSDPGVRNADYVIDTMAELDRILAETIAN